MTNTLYKKHRLAFPKKRKFCVLFSSFFIPIFKNLVFYIPKNLYPCCLLFHKNCQSHIYLQKTSCILKFDILFVSETTTSFWPLLTFVTYDTKTNFYFVRCFDLELDSGNYFLYFFHIFVCELASVVLCVYFADFLSM